MNEKDYRDYEVIVAEIQRFQGLSPQDQWAHWKAHPWDALAGVKTPDGGYINLPREARMRFRQIAERGLRANGARAQRHNPEKVYEELPRYFLELVVEGKGANINVENAHEVFDGALRNLEAAFREETHYVPCAVVMHRVRDVFTIGPVTFVRKRQSNPSVPRRDLVMK